ncbi:MAG: FAD-dependent oxidoreductase [Bacteroidota bacterium]
MLDCLVVGSGLAGIAFCEVLQQQQQTFTIIANKSQRASLVAGGLYNPVILKRFTLAWKADEQLEQAIPFYKGLEKRLGVQIDHKIPVLRRFASIEEQNQWFEAIDRPGLQPFLSQTMLQNTNPNIDAPYGLGLVRHTGRIDIQTLLRHYTKYLSSLGRFTVDDFDFKRLQIFKDHVRYKAVEARKVVFAMGYGLKSDPFFNYLPLTGTKGELLTINAPGLHEKSVVKSSVFIIPLGNDKYRVGATYKWKDKLNHPTDIAKKELLEKLKTFLKCDFEINDHVAGIRPTVTDRRPLVGQHPKFENLYVLNGFGSRGVLIAPYASRQLFDFIANGTGIDPEMDIGRFTKKYYDD